MVKFSNEVQLIEQETKLTYDDIYPIQYPSSILITANSLDGQILDGYVSVEDYSVDKIAVTVNLTTNSSRYSKFYITIKGSYKSATLANSPITTVLSVDNADINYGYTTFIVEKPYAYRNNIKFYLPLNFGTARQTINGNEELITFSEHHHPVQLSLTEKHNICYNDITENTGDYIKGNLVVSPYNLSPTSDKYQDRDLYEAVDGKILAEGQRSSLGITQQGGRTITIGGITISTAGIVEYVYRIAPQEYRYSTKLGIERIIFMSNRINVLGQTIPLVSDVSKVKDEYILSTDTLKPINTDTGSNRRLAGVKPTNLANFFIGLQIITANTVKMQSVIGLLEIRDNDNLDTTKPIVINLLTDESVLVITNNCDHSTNSINSSEVEVEIKYNDTTIGTEKIKLGNCDGFYIVDNTIAHYTIAEHCNTVFYGRVVHNNEQFRELLKLNESTDLIESVLIKKNDNDENGVYYAANLGIAGETLLPRIKTLGLDSDVFIDAGNTGSYIKIQDATKVINYRGASDTAEYGNGALEYSTSQDSTYDIVISSQFAFDYYFNNDKASIENKVVYIKALPTYNSEAEKTYSYKVPLVTKKYTCKAIKIDPQVKVTSSDATTNLIISADYVEGYIDVSAHNNLQIESSNDGNIKPITTTIDATKVSDFTTIGDYITKVKWGITPQGGSTWEDFWLIHHYHNDSTYYFRLEAINNPGVIVHTMFSASNKDKFLSTGTYYAGIAAYES